MSDSADEPQFALLVPRDSSKRVELLPMDAVGDRIRQMLDTEGGNGPYANINLGEGRAVTFGVGPRSIQRNQRAQVMLDAWGSVSIVLPGPVMFTGVSARQAVDLVRRAVQSPRVAVMVE